MSNGSELSLGERLNRKLSPLFTVLILLWIALTAFHPMLDNVDLGWHVAQGHWIVQHLAFYRHDLFNYPNLGQPIVHEYPFFQVILYLFHSLGWWGPSLLTALGYAVVALALVRAAREFDLGASCLPPVAIGLMFLCFQVAFPLRPHLATYLGVTLLGIFLLRHRHAARWTVFWPMALLQIAWTNSHSGFVLGPAMVALFGTEMILRDGLHHRSLPWAAIRTWLAAFFLILAACFINPHLWARFGPPFYQDSLESIRAYVGEMEPLNGFLAAFYGDLSLVAALLIVTAIGFRRGAVSVAFLVFAFFFHHQALEVKKAWPVFGLFLPLIVLSTGAFSPSFALRKPLPWLSVAGHAVLLLALAFGLCLQLAPSSPVSVASSWRQYKEGRTELSRDAAAWLKAHHAAGRLFHRCEDGGLLQMEGFDRGETFADTGFGKYSEAFIHEVGLVNERPALVPRFLGAFHPDYTVCGTFCYQWPFYLRQSGWKPVFYSPNSSVWMPSGSLDSAVPDAEIESAFNRDISAHGLPGDMRLHGRNLIALNSYGLEDFAFAKLTALPGEMHHAPWYWEAARVLCFEQPPFSAAHRAQLLAEAQQLHDDDVTAEFRAYVLHANGDTAGAATILEAIPYGRLTNHAALLLLQIYLDRRDPRAPALARRTDCFDLRNGHHWELLAHAEEQAGYPEAAARAWRKAVFYYPDDRGLMAAAAAFAAQHRDAALQQTVDAASHLPN